MSSLPHAPGGAQPRRRPHNPQLCGLGYHADCDICRAAADRAAEAALTPTDRARRRWEALCREHRAILGPATSLGQHHPEPLTAVELGRLLWSLYDPRTAAALRVALLQLLTPAIVEIVQVVVREEQA
jgi:hypothetical protein